eukprot:3483816-Rhodomonas_salina.1
MCIRDSLSPSLPPSLPPSSTSSPPSPPSSLSLRNSPPPSCALSACARREELEGVAEGVEKLVTVPCNPKLSLF